MSSRPTLNAVARYLLERKEHCLKLAEKSRSESKTGEEIYHRTIAAEADCLAAWMDGDDQSLTFAIRDKNDLEQAVKHADTEMFGRRLNIANQLAAIRAHAA